MNITDETATNQESNLCIDSNVKDCPIVEENGEAELSSDKPQHLTGMKLAFVMASLCATMFLVALDRTIIATAVPSITNQFGSLEDINWYASAYLVTSCATQLLWGRIYTFYATKAIFLAAVFVFEIGSTLCGAAPSSTTFIIGRAIAGTGSAGILSGITVITTQILPLQKRPIYVGMMGSLFGLSSIIGPLIGGAFTDHVSWRWCFYINLPIGAATLAVLIPFLHIAAPRSSDSLARQFLRLDPLGMFVFLPSVVSFMLALQWGGVKYAWENGRVVTLFVVSGMLALIFVAIQIWRQEDATTPPRIIRQRSIGCGMAFSFLIGGGLVLTLYLLPLWFQGVKGTTAVQSGINTIPMVLGLVVAATLSGSIISRTGYYVPWMFLSTILVSIAAGLTTTFQPNTKSSKWIGYQVIFGFGLGVGMQQPSLAAQAVLEQKDVPIGISLVFFTQGLGGAVLICIAQTLFTNSLATDLNSIPGLDVPAILAAGATELLKLVPAQSRDEVVKSYNAALMKGFLVAVVVGCLMLLPALGMEWKNIKHEKQSENDV